MKDIMKDIIKIIDYNSDYKSDTFYPPPVYTGESQKEFDGPMDVTHAVDHPRPSAAIVKENFKQMDDSCDCVPTSWAEVDGSLTDTKIKTLSAAQQKMCANSSATKFEEEIKIDFIPSIDYRIMCRFLGISVVNNIKNNPYTGIPLITLLLMSNVAPFMEKKGYSFAGELNFDREGNSIPCERHVWKVNDKEISFTRNGFQYFEKDSSKEENVVFYLFTNLEHGISTITCYTKNKQRSEKIINELETYTKENNCLKGRKIKDINMFGGTFTEIESNDKYNWDNYYYSQEVINLFDLEVFGFVKNAKKYNDLGISKRGIILHGTPGSGKTTLGYIICNNVPDNTVIWITPEIIAENGGRALASIKLLYILADFVSPTILIIEDLDLFSNDRDRGGDLLGLGTLMNVLDGVNTIKNSVTIGTTNRLLSIEVALRNRPGRFDRIIEIPPLDSALRERMFKDRLSLKWKISTKTLKYVVERTDGWTGAEVQEFVNTLNLKTIQKNIGQTITIKIAEQIIETMKQFGVGEKSSKVFGFVSGEK